MLDAVLPENTEQSVVIGITEKIGEERGNSSDALSVAQRVGNKLAGNRAERVPEEGGREAVEIIGFTPIGPELLPNPSSARGRANWELWGDTLPAGDRGRSAGGATGPLLQR